jgi:hypothetical protein
VRPESTATSRCGQGGTYEFENDANLTSGQGGRKRGKRRKRKTRRKRRKRGKRGKMIVTKREKRESGCCTPDQNGHFTVAC